jgi:hypothetical protein
MLHAHTPEQTFDRTNVRPPRPHRRYVSPVVPRGTVTAPAHGSARARAQDARGEGAGSPRRRLLLLQIRGFDVWGVLGCVLFGGVVVGAFGVCVWWGGVCVVRTVCALCARVCALCAR